MQRVARMKRELQMLQQSPPHGVSCWSKEDNIENLEAQVIGGEGTPYSGGIFKLEIQIPERYPFEPPKMKFITPIYHPNIDTAGRICLDSLKMPPKGAWKPALNISTLLTSIQLLMAEPNPDDPLMTDISNEYKFDRPTYVTKAKEWTLKYATDKGKENDSQKRTGTTESTSSKSSISTTETNKRPLAATSNSDSTSHTKKPKP